MKKVFVGLFMFICLSLSVFGQTFGEKRLFKSFDKWVIMSNGKELSMRAFITIQDILTIDNEEIKKSTLKSLPKYRYEIYLVSTSQIAGKSYKICVYNTKIFIDGVEVTKRQFPEGFNFLINTKPTMIYWYESNNSSIDVKITWSDVCFFKE